MTDGHLFEPPRARAKRKPPLPDGAMQRLIVSWQALFLARFGARPVLTPADASALKRLASDQGVEAVDLRLPQYIRLDDEYLAREGYPLALLPRAWNKLVVAEAPARATAPGAAATDAYLSKLKAGRL